MGNESEQNSHHAGPIIAYIEMSSSSGSESGRSKALAQPCSASLRANRLVTPENVWIDETLVVFSGPIFSTLEPPLYPLIDDACLFCVGMFLPTEPRVALSPGFLYVHHIFTKFGTAECTKYLTQ